MDEMNRIRKITLTGLLLLFALLPLAAQERTDTVYTFRFVTGNDMFYVPWNGNDKELARLEACVERLKERIFAGEIPVRVEGYCTSLGSEVDNLAMAKIRSNRVKSELIIRQGLTEACFVTKNHSGSGDYVTVRISVPKVATAVQKDERQQAGQESADTQQEQRETEESRFVAEQIRADSMVVVHPEAYVPTETTGTAAEETSGTDSYTLSLRANFLRWATLTPDLGIEWRISSSVGIMVNGSWTSWTWQDNARRYALWEVMPEVRWYLGEKKAWYVGAMFKAGEFNYKLSTTGKQGDLMGGGITGGYQLPLTEALSMDFSLGLGYLNADTEKYDVIYGVRVRSGNETKHWVGPINAGVTLVWKIF